MKENVYVILTITVTVIADRAWHQIDFVEKSFERSSVVKERCDDTRITSV